MNVEMRLYLGRTHCRLTTVCVCSSQESTFVLKSIASSLKVRVSFLCALFLQSPLHMLIINKLADRQRLFLLLHQGHGEFQ